MKQGARIVEFEAFFSAISTPEFLDQVQDGMYVVDADRRIVFWNKAAEELTGFKSPEMLGRRCAGPDALGHRTVSGESLCTDDACPLIRCMRSGEGGTVPSIILMSTASGRPLPISLSVGALHARDGRVAGAIALFRGMREEYRQRKLSVEIQRRTITSNGFSRNGVRVDTLYVPVDVIGGDFIEAFFLDAHTLIATVADATGHGVSASLFTMVYKSLLHASFAQSRDPAVALQTVNRSFLETVDVEGFYVSACLVRWDTMTRRGVYAAAGHPRSMLFSPHGKGFRLREDLAARSLMLGMEENARYDQQEFSLDKGEFLLLATDGILESLGSDGRQFGYGGVIEFFSCYRGDAPLTDLLAEVKRHSPGQPLADDVSALLISPN
jgi:serine phosphatase RsbU (regulator of sigma subunit)